MRSGSESIMRAGPYDRNVWSQGANHGTCAETNGATCRANRTPPETSSSGRILDAVGAARRKKLAEQREQSFAEARHRLTVSGLSYTILNAAS